MELWDLFDNERQPLNKTHRRGDKMRIGEFHTVAEIWTVNSNNDVLLTLRDPRKESYPNKWECTGGSVLSGESSRQGAVRELREETGIKATEDELILLDTCMEKSSFVDIYLLRRDIPINTLTMQEGETVAAKWIPFADLKKAVSENSIALPICRRLEFVRDRFEKEIAGHKHDF